MSFDQAVNLALRKSWFYPSAEIYSSRQAGFFDFAAEGLKIREKIINQWRRIILEKEDFIEISGSVVLPKDVFIASGHLENFNDPVVECSKCNTVFRADHLIQKAINRVVPESLSVNEIQGLVEEHKIKCSKCNSHSLKKVQQFSLMIKTFIGSNSENESFLRPETCQNMFSAFPRLYKNSRQSLPFGIAQAGKSFRNEISPRNYLIRERELHQMETEFFFDPEKINAVDDSKWDSVKKSRLNFVSSKGKSGFLSFEDLVKKKIVSGKIIAYQLALLQEFFLSLGISFKKTRFRELTKDEKPFYSKETFDFEIQSSSGFIEITACNYRTDHDLKRHEKQSKEKLSVKEEGREILPHVFEMSIGLDRTFLMILEHAFRKEVRGQDERIFLSLPAVIAPYSAGIFPLVKKDGLREKAFETYSSLKKQGSPVLFDDKGAVGRRYARIDEMGVPFAVTFDYDSLKDNSVTLRERDSMAQKRVLIKDLSFVLWRLMQGLKQFREI